MNKLNSFKDLKVWEKAHKLVLEIYRVTRCFPNYELYGLVSQMRRCVVSVASNIAEAFKRRGRDKFNFYNYAESSLEELKSQMLLSQDLKYMTEVDYLNLVELASEVNRMLSAWVKSLK
ncbi:MAG: four helix bundle protein [Patescibacteria group bacterium]